ncbi:hypothetical protein [Polaribacter sp. SA4-12]
MLGVVSIFQDVTKRKRFSTRLFVNPCYWNGKKQTVSIPDNKIT